MSKQHFLHRTKKTAFILLSIKPIFKTSYIGNHAQRKWYHHADQELDRKLANWQTKTLLEMDRENIIKTYFELLQKNSVETSIVEFSNSDHKPVSKNTSYSLSDDFYKKQLFERLQNLNELSDLSRTNYFESINQVSNTWLSKYLNGERLKKTDSSSLDFTLQNYIDCEAFNLNMYNSRGKLTTNWKSLDLDSFTIGDFVLLNVSDSSNVLDKFKLGILLKLPFAGDSDIIMYCSDGELYHLNPKTIILKLGKIMKIDSANVATLFENLYERRYEKSKLTANQHFLSNCNLDIIPKGFQKIFQTVFLSLKQDIKTNYEGVGYFMNKLDLNDYNDIESLYLKVYKKINPGAPNNKTTEYHFDSSVLICLLLQLLSRNNNLFTNTRGVPLTFKSNVSLDTEKSAISNYIVNEKSNLSNKLYMVQKLLKMNVPYKNIGKINCDVLYENEKMENDDDSFIRNSFGELKQKTSKRSIALTEAEVAQLDTKPLKSIIFNKPVYCIDSADTFEVDDGISIETLSDNKIRVHCHIASLGRFFLGMEQNKTKKQIFDDALKVSTSVYLPDCKDPMIAEKNILNFYSFNENKNNNKSLTFNVDFTKQKNIWKLEKNTFSINEYESLSELKRFTYEQIDSMIESDSNLCILSNLTEQLKRERTKSSKIPEREFAPKSVIKIDDVSRIIERHSKNTFTKSQVLVSEIMLLFNYLVAEYCANNSIPIIFRNNDLPLNQDLASPEKYTINKKKLGAIQPVDPLIIENPASEYSIYPRQHYASRLPKYTHITSPLRRIVDTINHIEILNYIRKNKNHNSLQIKNQLKLYLNRHIISTMKIAKMNSNKAERYYTLQFLKQGDNLKDLLSVGGTVVESPLNLTALKEGNGSGGENGLSFQDLPSDDIEIRRSISVVNVDNVEEKNVEKSADDVIIGNSKNLYINFHNGIVAKLLLTKNQKNVQVGDYIKYLKLERLDAIAGDFFVSMSD